MKINDYTLFTLMITNQCNHRCKYCYIDYNKKVMSKEVIDKLVSTIGKEIDKEEEFIHIDIFGGEPLLEKDLIKYIIESFSDKNPEMYSITIFTNLTLIDREFAEFIAKYENVGYNISLDGCKESHDSARVYLDGSGTYDDVIKSMKIVGDAENINWKDLSFKYVINPYNMKYLAKNFKDLLAIGLINMNYSLARDGSWKTKHINDFKKYLYEAADEYINIFNAGNIINDTIFIYPLIDYTYKSESYCSAGKSECCIDYKGDVYPCARFATNEHYLLGNIFKDPNIDKTSFNYKLFKNYSVENNFASCNECITFNKCNCLGSCIAANDEVNHNIFKPIDVVCEILKISFEVSRYVFKSLQNNNNYMKLYQKHLFGISHPNNRR